MWQDTSECDGGSDQSVQFLITSNGQLQMSRSDTLDLEILGGIACEFQDFSSQVFENGGDIYGGYTSKGGESCSLQIKGLIDEPLAPTRILFWVLFLRNRLTRPQGNWRVKCQLVDDS